MPIDNGHLIVSAEDYKLALREDKNNKELIRRYTGGDEFLNNIKRYCLWLVDVPPNLIRGSAFATQRIKRVKAFRENSGRATTQNLALMPSQFGEIRQPQTAYLLLPKVSSENRRFMPIGFVNAKTIASGSALIIPKAKLFHFGVLSSSAHNAWMRAVCGRMKSDYQYSAGIVYNNFPWPQAISDKALQAIESAGQAVLDARAMYPGSSLADLYDPNTMPPVLTKAHQKLDKAVDAAYKYKGGKEDAPRVAFLFERYQALTSLLLVEKAKRKRMAKS